MLDNDFDKPDLSVDSAVIKGQMPTIDDFSVEEMLAQKIDILNREKFLMELLKDTDGSLTPDKKASYTKQLEAINTYLEQQTKPQTL